MGTVQIAVDRKFQGTLKFLLERAAHEYRAAVARGDASENTRNSWQFSAEQCLAVAAQLRRT